MSIIFQLLGPISTGLGCVLGKGFRITVHAKRRLVLDTVLCPIHPSEKSCKLKWKDPSSGWLAYFQLHVAFASPLVHRSEAYFCERWPWGIAMSCATGSEGVFGPQSVAVVCAAFSCLHKWTANCGHLSQVSVHFVDPIGEPCTDRHPGSRSSDSMMAPF